MEHIYGTYTSYYLFFCLISPGREISLKFNARPLKKVLFNDLYM